MESPARRRHPVARPAVRVFEGIAAVTLLVGLIGVLNIGLPPVRERAEEFALRRAVGTTRLQLTITVLTEPLLVALAATVGGTDRAAVLLQPATETFFPGTDNAQRNRTRAPA